MILFKFSITNHPSFSAKHKRGEMTLNKIKFIDKRWCMRVIYYIIYDYIIYTPSNHPWCYFFYTKKIGVFLLVSVNQMMVNLISTKRENYLNKNVNVIQ